MDGLKMLARRRWAVIAGALVCAGLGVFYVKVLPARPRPMDWTPVYRGIEMRCDDAATRGKRLMALRVNLDEPTLEIVMRPLDAGAVSQRGHYFLTFGAWERYRNGYQVLMNTTIYAPGEKWKSYPGQVVRAVDTVVAGGRATHIHEHSYLLWVDQSGAPRMETKKPPPPASIAAARWGIGLQGVQVGGGKPRYQAVEQHGAADARSFIGFDGNRRLYLIAWESATPREMIDTALRLGVEWGGQLDSGSATHLLLGADAQGVRPLTGIHGARPLGPYLGIRALPLSEQAGRN
jgi:hypothetical protein